MSKVVTLSDLSDQISVLAKAVLLNKETLTIEEAAIYTGLSTILHLQADLQQSHTALSSQGANCFIFPVLNSTTGLSKTG